MKKVFTDSKLIKDLYRMAYTIHNIFIKNGILYYATGGTLMGAVRHKGIIPWDNDLDFEIGYQDIPKLLSTPIKKQFDAAGYRVQPDHEGWVKIYKKGTSKVYADIFPVYIEADSAGRLRTWWDFDLGEEIWSKCYNYVKDIYPLKEYKFGAIKVLGPKNPIPTLNRCYGRTWKTKGYITQDIHHGLLEKPILVQAGDFKPAKNFYTAPKTKPQLVADKFYLQGKLVSMF